MRSAAWYRAVDDATVELLEATSWRSQRDHLVDCGGCGMPFWARAGSLRLYCSAACCSRAFYRSHEAYRVSRSHRQRVDRLNKRAQEVSR